MNTYFKIGHPGDFYILLKGETVQGLWEIVFEDELPAELRVLLKP